MVTGDEIANCALRTFEKIPESRKPRVLRSRKEKGGSERKIQEWTVLAAIVKETSGVEYREDQSSLLRKMGLLLISAPIPMILSARSQGESAEIIRDAGDSVPEPVDLECVSMG